MKGFLLAIDIGNTTSHIGAFDGDRLVCSFRLASTHARTVDEAALLLRQIFRDAGLSPPPQCPAVIGSVVPVLTAVLGAAVETVCGAPPLIVSHRLDLGIDLAVPFPEQVGADRIANAVGFRAEHQAAGIVVDFGTATTFDVISLDGAYLGGAIAPGLESSTERLSQKAAQLFKVNLEQPPSPVGTTTETALKSGLFYGAVGSVDEIVNRISETFDTSPEVVATGGLAEIIAPASRTIRHVDPILTLKGLAIILQRNSNQK